MRHYEDYNIFVALFLQLSFILLYNSLCVQFCFSLSLLHSYFYLLLHSIFAHEKNTILFNFKRLVHTSQPLNFWQIFSTPVNIWSQIIENNQKDYGAVVYWLILYIYRVNKIAIKSFSKICRLESTLNFRPRLMYKISVCNISGVRSYVNNHDWRLVMANYVCMQCYWDGWEMPAKSYICFCASGPDNDSSKRCQLNLT